MFCSEFTLGKPSVSGCNPAVIFPVHRREISKYKMSNLAENPETKKNRLMWFRLRRNEGNPSKTLWHENNDIAHQHFVRFPCDFMSQCEEVHCRKYSYTFIAGNTDGSNPSSFHDLENSCSQSLMLDKFLKKNAQKDNHFAISSGNYGSVFQDLHIHPHFYTLLYRKSFRISKFVSVLSRGNLAKKHVMGIWEEAQHISKCLRYESQMRVDDPAQYTAPQPGAGQEDR